jgi:alkanesulfonate monooxygenase SsuD/methylene tetrahydromethanopterin reductase-like flavin-dependent oxidoreductase (luciferase family)
MPADQLDKRNRGTYVADLDRALRLVAGHFHGAWLIDHLQFGDTDVLEAFTTLSYMAARHPEPMFGHMVVCQSFRNPALVAKMGATLQLLSGGRFILGVGAGWHEEEYRAYGYDFPPAGVRVTQLDEALRIIKALWTQERPTLEGRYYRVCDARCEPRPDPRPPVLVGAFRRRMLRIAAAHGDWWDVSSTGPERYRALAEEFERACAAIGRPEDGAAIVEWWLRVCVDAGASGSASRGPRQRTQRGRLWLRRDARARNRADAPICRARSNLFRR